MKNQGRMSFSVLLITTFLVTKREKRELYISVLSLAYFSWYIRYTIIVCVRNSFYNNHTLLFIFAESVIHLMKYEKV